MRQTHIIQNTFYTFSYTHNINSDYIKWVTDPTNTKLTMPPFCSLLRATRGLEIIAIIIFAATTTVFAVIDVADCTSSSPSLCSPSLCHRRRRLPLLLSLSLLPLPSPLPSPSPSLSPPCHFYRCSFQFIVNCLLLAPSLLPSPSPRFRHFFRCRY